MTGLELLIMPAVTLGGSILFAINQVRAVQRRKDD
jgi:hypothetical protein